MIDEKEVGKQHPAKKKKEVIILSWANRTHMRPIIFGMGRPFAFCSQFDKGEKLTGNSTTIDGHREPSPNASLNGSSTVVGSLDNAQYSDSSGSSGGDEDDHGRKRKYEEPLAPCDALSIIANGSKRPKIDEWARQCAEFRPTDMPRRGQVSSPQYVHTTHASETRHGILLSF
jgi:hypothetical protein